MRQLSFFDENYMQIIHKTVQIVQAVKQTFVNLITKVCDVVKISKGWKFKEIVMEVIKN